MVVLVNVYENGSELLPNDRADFYRNLVAEGGSLYGLSVRAIRDNSYRFTCPVCLHRVEDTWYRPRRRVVKCKVFSVEIRPGGKKHCEVLLGVKDISIQGLYLTRGEAAEEQLRCDNLTHKHHETEAAFYRARLALSKYVKNTLPTLTGELRRLNRRRK